MSAHHPAEAGDDSLAGQPEFKRTIATGVRWSTAALVGKQLGRAGISIVLARLLGPHSYGIVGQATIYILFVSFLLDGGFGAAYIQRRTVGRDEEGSLWLFSLASTLIMAAVTILVAPVLASVFRTSQLTAVVRVLAIDVAALGLAIAPTAILTRRLQLRVLALAEVSGTFVGGAAGILAAVAGAGYWSLVISVIVGDSMFLVIALLSAGLPRVRISGSALKEMGGFGASVISAQILYFLLRNTDNLVVGRVLGATALGYYALAYSILMLPQQTLGYMINRVSMPVFSRLQDDRMRMGRYFLRATTVLAAVSFPALALVIAAAHPAIPLVLGSRWAPAVRPMEILAAAGFMSTVQHLIRPVLYACRRQRSALKLQAVQTATAIVAFVIGSHWGISGVAIAVAVVFWTFQPVFVALAGRQAEFSLARYTRALLPASVSSGALIGAYKAVWLLLKAAHVPRPAGLAAAGVVGLATYLAALRFVWPAAFRDVWYSLRTFARPAALGAEVPAEAEPDRDPGVTAAAATDRLTEPESGAPLTASVILLQKATDAG